MNPRITIKQLRKECPGWAWLAERSGMGWHYYGARNGAHVRVHAVARLCGPGEDDFATQWLADDGKQSRSYAAWWLEHGAEGVRDA